MKTIAIIFGKLAAIAGKILGRGSVLPGAVALTLDKNLLNKLEYPKITIAVTGSSGKGSTTKLIDSVLKSCGYSTCYNDMGSNLTYGIATSLIKNSTLTGKIKKDYLIMEVDERYTPHVFKYIKPDYLIVTNLTKDQPPRQGDIDLVYSEIKKGILENTTIITTIDEPYMANFDKDLPNDKIKYSILKNKYSYKKQIFEGLNTYYCPYCSKRLEYDYYNFETLGKYKCNHCNFKWQKPEVCAEDLDLDSGTFKINNENIFIGGYMLYNAYNTISAYTLLKELKINEKAIIKNINKYNKNYKSINFKSYKKEFIPLNCKAENATTYNQAIFKAIQDKEPKNIVIGWKEISRRYNHFDVSWLYDIEFELLNDNTEYFYAVGINKEDIKKRLLIAGINEEKIITANSLNEIKEHVLKSKSKKIYGILNFDYINPFIETFKENNND